MYCTLVYSISFEHNYDLFLFIQCQTCMISSEYLRKFTVTSIYGMLYIYIVMIPSDYLHIITVTSTYGINFDILFVFLSHFLL